MIRRLRSLLLIITALAVARVAAETPHTVSTLLREFHDPATLERPFDPPRVSVAFSSRDDTGAGFHQGNFLRIEDNGEAVLLDVTGPGMLTRLWSGEPSGTLRFYFDGAAKPQWEIPWKDLFSERLAFQRLFFARTGDGTGGFRFPLPFSKGLKITLSDETWCEWQAEAALFPPETPVDTWWPGDPRTTTWMEQWYHAERAILAPQDAQPAGEDLHRIEVDLTDFAPHFAFTAPHPMLVRELRFIPADHDAELPEDFTIGIAENEPVSARLFFVAAGPAHPAAMLLAGYGSACAEWYFRVPFFLNSGDRIVLRGGQDEQTLGTLVLRGVEVRGDEADQLPRLWISATDQLGKTKSQPPRAARQIRVSLTVSDRAAPPDPDAAPNFHGGGLPPLTFAPSFGETIHPTVESKVIPHTAFSHSEFGPQWSMATTRAPLAAATDLAPPIFDDPKWNHPEAEPSNRVVRIGQYFLQEAPATLAAIKSPVASANRIIKLETIKRGPADELLLTLSEPVEGIQFRIPYGWQLGHAENPLHTFTLIATNQVSSAEPQLLQLMKDGALPLRIVVPPPNLHGDPRWSAEIPEQSAEGTFAFEMPDDFPKLPGDMLVVEWASAAGPPHHAGATLTISPPANPSWFLALPETIRDARPERLPIRMFPDTRDDTSRSVYPVGNLLHWAGSAKSIFITPDDPTHYVRSVRVYRRTESPTLAANTRWQPLPRDERYPGGFLFPVSGYHIVDDELTESLEPWLHAPGHQVVREWRNQAHLENIEPWLFTHRLWPGRHREDPLPPLGACIFVSRYVGEQVRLTHEALAGARRIAVRLGHDPRGGRVLIKDAAGRPIACGDTFLNLPVVLGRVLLIEFHEPNPGRHITFEAFGASPGSTEMRIVLERVVVLERGA